MYEATLPLTRRNFKIIEKPSCTSFVSISTLPAIVVSTIQNTANRYFICLRLWRDSTMYVFMCDLGLKMRSDSSDDTVIVIRYNFKNSVF